MELKNINELFTATGRVNSAILRRDWFKDTSLFKYIMDNSSELNVFGEEQVELSHRVWFIKDNMTIGECPVCHKPFLTMPTGHGNKTFTLCGCKKNYTSNSKSKLLSSRKRHYSEIKRYIIGNSDHQTLSDDSFNIKLDMMNHKPANYQFLVTNEYKDFYSDLLYKTKNILLIEEENLDIPQRLYIVNNQLKSIPICSLCGKKMMFYNRFKGYDCGCQRMERNQETRWLKYIKQIPNIVDETKYEILEIPKKLSMGLRIKCKECGNESVIRIKDGRLNVINKNSILCKYCGQYNGTSRAEKDIVDYVRSLVGNNEHIIENDRTLLNGKELDIYIPLRKLAFEYDGLYWHKNDSKRHLMKTELCEDNDVQLIHIFENEWLSKQDIVKSRIKNLLGVYDKVVYARKCEVKEVPSNDSYEFQNQNHIQGGVHSKVNLGLYYENELISLMTFSKPRFSKKYEWELVRFCNKLGYHIPGGASRLLKHFERIYNPQSIVSYADRRWSKGNLYERLNFTQASVSKPSYWYFDSVKFLESRVKYQKHNLKNVLSNFDESKSEWENMQDNGYSRIFDCGNLVYIRQYS